MYILANTKYTKVSHVKSIFKTEIQFLYTLRSKNNVAST